MKIEIKKTSIKTIDVELPVYRKTLCHFYKVYSDEKCVQVCTAEENESIGIYHAGLAYHLGDNKDCKDCKEQEFLKALEKITKIINSKVYISDN